MNIAVIDVGSNSVHGLVVRVGGDLRPHVLDRAREMVRLGESVARTGRLDEAAMVHAIDAIRGLRRLAERRGADRILAVATNAVRVAENGGAFLQEIYSRTGVHVRLISGAEEARLVWRAVREELPDEDRPSLVVDLGGGSADFAFGSGRQLAWTESLDVGVQRLVSRFLPAGETSSDTVRAIEEHVRPRLRVVLDRLRRRKAERVVVTAGSAAAVERILAARGGSPPDTLPFKSLLALEEELAQIPRDERALLAGIEQERVDLVVPAVTFFRLLAEVAQVEELKVSEAGLRDGIVLEYLDAHGTEIQWELTEPNARRRAVLRFAERLGYDAAHAHHVAVLSVQLFDATSALHKLDEPLRELLEYAAFLHDVGYAVNERAHHKHSEYLVLHGLDGGFTEREVRIIAAIGRYHRKGPPKEAHENFAALDDEDRERVRKAAAILRIADGLDRTHTRAVRRLAAVAGEETVAIEVDAEGPADVELWAARKKAGLFEDVYARRADIRRRPAAVIDPEETP